MNSTYTYHTNIEEQKSVTVVYDFEENTSFIVQWDAIINIGFQPDEVIVEAISYKSSGENTVYAIYAQFCQSTRQTYENALSITQSTMTNILGTIVDGISYSPQIHIPIRSALNDRTQFTMEALNDSVYPVGVVTISMRFVKYLQKVHK